MREIKSHQAGDDHVIVRALDEPGPGGASSQYELLAHKGEPEHPTFQTVLKFQSAPLSKATPNGVTNEALLAIVIDRLEGFQAGPCPCAENAMALPKLRDALEQLHERTRVRRSLNIEGTMKTPEQVAEEKRQATEQEAKTLEAVLQKCGDRKLLTASDVAILDKAVHDPRLPPARRDAISGAMVLADRHELYPHQQKQEG